MFALVFAPAEVIAIVGLYLIGKGLPVCSTGDDALLSGFEQVLPGLFPLCERLLDARHQLVEQRLLRVASASSRRPTASNSAYPAPRHRPSRTRARGPRWLRPRPRRRPAW